MNWTAARRGLASNGRLGLAAVVLGVLALAGVVGIDAIAIMAISQFTG
ncbi:hypothetical protein [Demequina aestuarii]|nr:hypothetical protein [Demequina aestuarii]